ncbi:MAG: family 20 glycosylhydrolase [Erysipelotrichaceae bacterium]|nr:family 20 glycosylhydrolase [Erysipelotrichaceae bacterium]
MKQLIRMTKSLMAFALATTLITPITSHAADTTVRVATFNIAASKKPDIAQMSQLLANNTIDVVGVQEVDVNTTRNSYDMLAKFAELGVYTNTAFQKSINMSDGVGEYGIGLISKLPLTNTGGAALNSDGLKEARAYIKSEVTVDGKTVSVYNTHLTHESQEARAKQLLEVKSIMDSDSNDYKILFGDFNTDQSHDEINPFLTDYNAANGKDGKWFDTYNGVDATMKTNAIDNIITTRNIQVDNITMVETTLSDHNLFYLDATLLDQPVVSRELLNKVIEQANALDEDRYSDASNQALDEKLVAGETLSESATQEEVNNAAAEIQTAMNQLQTKYPNLALNKSVSVSGLEVNDGRFAAELAVDGVVSSTSRVSFAKDVDEQWLTVDLGQEYNISHLKLNYESCPPSFKIQVSTDGTTFTDVHEESNLEDGGPTVIKEIDIEPVNARYVKYVQLKRWKHSSNGKYYSGIIYEFEVYEKDPDAKNYDNLALNQTVTVSGLEVNDGRFTGPMAVDGAVSNESRVSFAKDKDEQWLQVDFGFRRTVSHFVLNYESCPPSFKIQVSTDGVNYTDVYTATGLPDGGPSEIKEIDINPIKARYVRYVQLKRWTHTSNKKQYSGSIYEFEIYKQVDRTVITAEDVLKQLNNEAPTIEGNQLKMPEVPEGFEISLYGSDNKQVVAMDGSVYTPLQDMDVNVMYQVKNLNDEDDVACSEADIKITVPGQYAASGNAKPNVLPGLREWKGGTGTFQLTASSQIVYTSDSQKAAADVLKTYLKDMLGMELNVVKAASGKAGDIVFAANYTTDELGTEGYYMDIAEAVTISAPGNTENGWIYGAASITQILYQNDNTAPKGLTRDYPQYEVRAGMIDVGRMYIPLEYLEEMTIYMSFYKMNEAHIHINDYWGQSGYSAFRLESKVYPSINAKDGYYTQEEYRQYQKDMKVYGIDVITELDTPYHADALKDIEGVVMWKAGYLDIRTEDAFNANAKIIENLIDEFLDGPDPVIQSENFHIGTDEYDKAYGEQMRKWTDHFAKYVNAKGYQSRAWASLGKNGFNGTTPVTSDIVMNLWAPYWADVHETYNAGYDVINTYGGWLYIVPAANAGYPDRFDTKKLYEKFEVNDFKSGRNPSGEAIMPVAHPQTKGASFALWNDMTSFRTGFSWFDIHDRIKDAVSLVSEKTWYGEDDNGQTYAQFRERIDALQNKVPNANPGRYVESDTDLIAEYDFEENGTTVKDNSANGYDASLTKASAADGAVKFDGSGYLSLPMDSIGYPYSVFMNLTLDELNENATLFAGADGTFYVNKLGKLSYARDQYEFTFNYTPKANKEISLALVCDNKNLTLYIDGKQIGNGKLTNTTIAGKTQQSSTFVLPVEKVFENTKGTLSKMSVYNRALSADEVLEKMGIVRENLALNKTVSVSGLEVSDGRFTAEMAVDGVVSKESRVSFAKDKDEQWLLVDLGDVYNIGDLVINYESKVGKYEIQVSTDGVNFEPVYRKNEAQVVVAAGVSAIEKISIEPVDARYVKYVQKERWKNTGNNNLYSGSIYEFEVYAPLDDNPRPSIDALLALSPDTSGATTAQRQIGKNTSDKVNVEFDMVTTTEDTGIVDIPVGLGAYDSNHTSYTQIPMLMRMYKDGKFGAYNGNQVDGKAVGFVQSDLTYEPNTSYHVRFAVDLGKSTYSVYVTPPGETEVCIGKDYAYRVAAPQDLGKLYLFNIVSSIPAGSHWLDHIKLTDVDSQSVDKSELDRLISELDQVEAGNYTDESWSKFCELLDYAKEVSADEFATEANVQATVEALKTATDILKEKVDKTALAEAIKAASAIKADGYTKVSYQALQDAIANGETVMADEAATKADVEEALQLIKDAEKALVKTADKTKLQKAIKDYSYLLKKLSDYPKTMADAFKKAYKNAEKVNKDSEAVQADADSAWNALVKAAKALENYNKPNPKPDYNNVYKKDEVTVKTDIDLGDVKLAIDRFDEAMLKAFEATIKDKTFLTKYSFEKLLDIYFVDSDGNRVKLDKAVNMLMSIQLDKTMLGKSLRVVHISDSGDITFVPSWIENNTINFRTTHNSHYAIVSTTAPSTNETIKPNSPIKGTGASQQSSSAMAWVTLLLLVGSAVYVTRRKQENN